jgi:hypothetical protein
MRKAPMAVTKEKYGSKDKLVDELLGVIKKPGDVSKEDLKKKLKSQSNRKLMRLLERETAVRDQFGGREALVDAILKSRMGKEQKEDKDFRKRLTGLSSGQLLDLARRFRVAAQA